MLTLYIRQISRQQRQVAPQKKLVVGNELSGVFLFHLIQLDVPQNF